MTNILVDLSDRIDVTREGDPDDSYDDDDVYHDVCIYGIKEVPETDYFDFTVPFSLKDHEDFWLVYAIYDTGDSFHREDGVHCMIDLYTSKDRAKRAVNTFQQHYAKYKDDHTHTLTYTKGEDNEFSCHYERDDGSVIPFSIPWTGYFERLQNICCERVDKDYYHPGYKT